MKCCPIAEHFSVSACSGLCEAHSHGLGAASPCASMDSLLLLKSFQSWHLTCLCLLFFDTVSLLLAHRKSGSIHMQMAPPVLPSAEFLEHLRHNRALQLSHGWSLWITNALESSKDGTEQKRLVKLIKSPEGRAQTIKQEDEEETIFQNFRTPSWGSSIGESVCDCEKIDCEDGSCSRGGVHLSSMPDSHTAHSRFQQLLDEVVRE